MRGYLRITKLLLGLAFRKGLPGKRSPRTMLAGSIIASAILSACIAVGMGFIGAAIADLGSPSLTAIVMGYLILGDFMLTLVFGTLTIMSYLYFSRDSEFFLSLPVGSNAVLCSKLTVIYIEEALVSAILVLPGSVVLGAVTGQTAMFYVVALIAVAFVPLAAVLLGGIVSVPLSYIAGFFRNRGAVAAVLMLVLFAALMAAYMIVPNVMSSSLAGGATDDVVAVLEGTFMAALYVVYPLFCLARAGTLSGGLVAGNAAASAAVDLAIFFGTIVALAAILLPLSALFYKRSILRQSEHAGGSSAKKGDYVRSGVLGSLVKKELKTLLRNASFAFQCLAGCVLSPVMCVFAMMVTGMDSTEAAGEQIGETAPEFIFVIIWPMCVFLVVLMLGSLNLTALTSVTREGKTFIYSKLIPVPYSVQITAKRISAILPASISAVVSLICMSVTTGITVGIADPLSILTALLLFAAAIVLSTEFYIYRDLKKPRLDWNTPREAVKNNSATLLPMFIGMLVAVAVAVVLVLSGIMLYLAGWGMYGVSLSTFLCAAALVALFFAVNSRVSMNADMLYSRLSV